MHFWNSVFTFVFVILCDAYITHAATDKPYRADHRETVHKIWFRHVLDDLELKIFFVGQPSWPTCFMLHLPRNLGPPAVTFSHLEAWPLRNTLCLVSRKSFSKFPDIQFWVNLKIIPSCQTLSNAFEMLRKRPLTS